MKPKMNKPCPCGSGRKFKKCCWSRQQDINTKKLAEERDKHGVRMVFASPVPPRQGAVDHAQLRETKRLRAAQARFDAPKAPQTPPEAPEDAPPVSA
jgi:hypothetical protein